MKKENQTKDFYLITPQEKISMRLIKKAVYTENFLSIELLDGTIRRFYNPWQSSGRKGREIKDEELKTLNLRAS